MGEPWEVESVGVVGEVVAGLDFFSSFSYFLGIRLRIFKVSSTEVL